MRAGNERKRVDGRSESQVRPLRISTGVSPYAEGSAEAQLGSTKILVSASIDTPDAKSAEAGRIYASIGMLPRSMHVRIKDAELEEVVKQELRGLQQLLVRSLAAAVPSEAIGNLAISVECTIVCSDAGIASAAVAGAWVALYQSLRWATRQKLISEDVYITRIAAISAGIIGDQTYIDLCAEEAGEAEFTANFVFDEHAKLVDLKGAREKTSVSVEHYEAMLNLAAKQVSSLLLEEERAVLEMA